jgi:hypothetical protein
MRQLKYLIGIYRPINGLLAGGDVICDNYYVSLWRLFVGTPVETEPPAASVPDHDVEGMYVCGMKKCMIL